MVNLVNKESRVRWNPVNLLEWAIFEHGNATYKLAVSSLASVGSLDEIPGGPYTPHLSGTNFFGHQKLREVLAGMYGVEAEQILVAQGAAECDYLIAGAALQEGGTAIIETPVYEPICRAAECFADRIVSLPRRKESGCLPDPDEFRNMVDSSTRLICLTNLHNPTGAFIDNDLMSEISSIAAECGATVLVDEVFMPMLDWDYRNHSAKFGCVSVGSMDKTYGLTNLRVGWAVGPKELIRKANSFNVLLGVHQPFITEDLASQILADNEAMSWFRSRCETAQKGRKLYDGFIDGFPQSEYTRPAAGINGILSLPAGSDDKKFVEALQRQKDTVAFPGSLFGLPETIRVSFGGEMTEMEEGFKRLGELYREW